MPGWRDWLFSAKTFAAAMAALWIALAADLERPYWAMATAYIASQPLSGATRSKALYRLLGTGLGAVAAVVLVPGLNGSPELLCVAMVLWTALCLTLALLDRTPKTYVFLLAAYSAPIIGFPAVAAPEGIWTTAATRFEEIGLGIVCASLVAGLVFPRHVGPAVVARTTAWFGTAQAWTLDVLEGRDTPEEARRNRRQLAGGITEVDALAAHLRFDPSGQYDAVGPMAALRVRMLMLLPVISSIADRVRGLQAAEAFPPVLQALLARVAAALRSGMDDAGLPAAIEAMQPPLDAQSDWPTILLTGLLARLRELVDLHADCRVLQAQVAGTGNGQPVLRFEPEAPIRVVQHQDWGMALFSGAAAGAAVGLTCLFWIASAWPEGAVAAEMTAVGCCFFASMDDPVPAILSFLRWTGVAILVVGVYQFAILPQIHDFLTLVLVLAPTFLVVGSLIPRPATAPIGLALAANTATLMSLQSAYTADFATYANSSVATLIGMVIAAVLTQLIRSVGAEWSVFRLARANWASLARAAERRGAGDRASFAGLMLDRFAMAVPRLAASSPDSPIQQGDSLAELRTGLNIVALRRARRGLDAAALSRIDRVLDGLARHFRALSRQSRPGAVVVSPVLQNSIDTAMEAVAACPPGTERRDAIQGLVGLRRGLLPDALPYAPQAPSAPRSGAALPAGAS